VVVFYYYLKILGEVHHFSSDGQLDMGSNTGLIYSQPNSWFIPRRFHFALEGNYSLMLIRIEFSFPDSVVIMYF
jgi:hypothetical protein